MKAVFLDREGTLVNEPYDEVLDSPEKLYIFDETLEAMRRLATLDYSVFLLVNENALAQKRITPEQFQAINAKLMALLAPSGVKIEKVYYCPHAADANCDCRKPKPGMVKLAMQQYPIEIGESWVIGDRLQDTGLGKAVGARTILIDRQGKFGEGTADHIVPNLKEAIDLLANPLTVQF